MNDDEIRDLVREELRAELDRQAAARAKMIDEALLRVPISKFTGVSYDIYFTAVVRELSKTLGQS